MHRTLTFYVYNNNNKKLPKIPQDPFYLVCRAYKKKGYYSILGNLFWLALWHRSFQRVMAMIYRTELMRLRHSTPGCSATIRMAWRTWLITTVEPSGSTDQQDLWLLKVNVTCILHWKKICFSSLLIAVSNRGAWWLSGRVSDSGARGRGFETYRRRVVSLSKTLYSPKVLVNYPGSGGSVQTWLKNCWLGR